MVTLRRSSTPIVLNRSKTEGYVDRVGGAPLVEAARKEQRARVLLSAVPERGCKIIGAGPDDRW